MISAVRAFRAQDGSLHENERDAARHEAVEAIRSWIAPLLKNSSDDTVVYPQDYALIEVADRMLDDHELLTNILAAYRHSLPSVSTGGDALKMAVQKGRAATAGADGQNIPRENVVAGTATPEDRVVTGTGVAREMPRGRVVSRAEDARDPDTPSIEDKGSAWGD